MAEPFQLPSASVVIGHVVAAFDLRFWDPGEHLSSRTAFRFFKGKKLITADKRLDILRAVTQALRASGLLQPFPPLDFVVEKAFTANADGEGQDVMFLHALAADWDAIAGVSCSPTPQTSSRQLAGYAALQMVVVDLSIRLAGLLSLRGSANAEALPSYWFRPRGIADWLRSRMLEAGLTGDGLAVLADVDASTVDTWLAGARPLEPQLCRLASGLAKTREGESEVELLRALHLAYGMNALFELVQEHVGLEAATACAERLSTYPTTLVAFMRQRRLAPHELWFALIGGTVCKRPWLRHALDRLVDTELDPVWRTTVLDIQRGWLRRLRGVAMWLNPSLDERVTRYLGLSDSPELQQRIRYLLLASLRELAFDVVRRWLTEKGNRFGPLARVALVVLWTPTDAATHPRQVLALLRLVAGIAPENATVHVWLAWALQHAGDHDGALVELDIAAKLAPHWDVPMIQLASALHAAGRDPEALSRLKHHAADPRRPTPALLFCLASCYERMRNPDRAIQVYEELLHREPQHALALNNLAHLTFLSGKKGGAALAKRAALRGVTSTLDAWSAKRYRGRRRRST